MPNDNQLTITESKVIKEISPIASSHLDLIRAITAIAVASGHIRSLFFIDYGLIQNPNIFQQILYFVTGLGHQGVITFFVLSGLLVGGSVLKAVSENKWALGQYILARLSRLYVVLIPGLILTWLLDTVGMAVTHNSFIYSGSPIFGNIISFRIADVYTIKDFLGSLFFLQTIVTQPFGSNAPLWSLANEFWYYALFPLCLFLIIKKTKSFTRVVLGLVIVGTFLFVGFRISLLFLVWLFGVMVFIYYRSKNYKLEKGTWFFKLFLIIQFLIVLLMARYLLIKNALLMDFIFGFSIALCLWGILSFSKKDIGEWYKVITKKFAGFSYTLYVVHLPLVVFIHGMISAKTGYFSLGRWNPDPIHLMVAAAIFIVVMLYAYLIALMTENKTPIIRHKISSWLKKISSKSNLTT